MRHRFPDFCQVKPQSHKLWIACGREKHCLGAVENFINNKEKEKQARARARARAREIPITKQGMANEMNLCIPITAQPIKARLFFLTMIKM